MATGDQKDIARRLKSALPPSWFSNPAPNLWAVLQGPANVFASLYSQITFAKAQTRIATASGMFLDLIAFDYLGRMFRRKLNQGDSSFRATLLKRLLVPRQTRAAIVSAVENLTGAGVEAFEPWNAADTGGIGAAWAFNEPASAWGSANMPYQILINSAPPVGAGIPNLSGFSDSYSGWGLGYFYFADASLTVGTVTTQDIYDEINAARAAGVTAWLNIANPPPDGARLDVDFVLDSSELTDLPQDLTGIIYVNAELPQTLLALSNGTGADLGSITTTIVEFDDLGFEVDVPPASFIDLGTL